MLQQQQQQKLINKMDFVPSMFMNDLIDEDQDLLFSDSLLLSPLISYQDNDVCNLKNTNKICESKKKRRVSEAKNDNDDEDREIKKMKHRDIERQRRQEVSSLFKSLRSLLPFQYIQGKRSTSDHILEAVNYIKNLQNKTKELKEKRNKIKKSISGINTLTDQECTNSLSSSSTSSAVSSSSCSCVNDKHITVVVMPCLVGVEIIISCCLGQNKFRLSSVLQMLDQEQSLNVVSCLSTRLQHRFVHTIVSQAQDGKLINVSKLKDKLTFSEI